MKVTCVTVCCELQTTDKKCEDEKPCLTYMHPYMYSVSPAHG